MFNILIFNNFFRYLVAKQEKMENSKENDDKNDNSEAANKTEKEDDSKIGIEKKKLEQALKNARLEHQVIVKQ